MPSPLTSLADLERMRLDYGPGCGAAKRALLLEMEHAVLPGAKAVHRLHEMLCFLRAYPDDAPTLAQVVRMLEAFAGRADLATHRDALADSGIAGTAIHYRFFAAQAQWLAANWPAQLVLDRAEPGAQERIVQALPLLVPPAVADSLREAKPDGHAAIDRLRSPDTTDATWLLARIAAMPGDERTRQAFGDAIDAGFTLHPGPGTPARTLARWGRGTVVFRRAAPPAVRPDLRAELARPPRAIRSLREAEGEALVDTARAAMVTRARALDAFSYGNPQDAWLAEDGDGLAFAFAGVVPARRQVWAALYGGLMLRNGVPVGYVQADITGRIAAVSFNTFDTFRGGEAAFLFARLLAALRAVFGTTSFSLEPYQLGDGNDEGIASGAWWFYAKAGFAPRDQATLKLARAEEARQRREPGYRSKPATLRVLARRHLFFDLDPANPCPLPPLGGLGLRAGADEHARDATAGEALRRCGMASMVGLRPPEREALHRWAPLIALLDLEAWTDAERRALVDVVRAKGGRGEWIYLERYRAHPRLDEALRRAAGGP